MDIFWRPVAAITLLLAAAVLNLALPVHNDLLLAAVNMAAVVIPASFGYWLWYKICLTRDWWPSEWVEPEIASIEAERSL